MAFDFTEDVTIALPSEVNNVVDFVESTNTKEGGERGLIVEVAAVHEGLTNNYTNYSAAGLEASLRTWTEPYAKPILRNHDMTSEPLGRVMAAKMDTEGDGTPYTRLQVAILDPIAIEKVLDERYITGSVGGRSKEAICSVCDTDWANPKEFFGPQKLPCKHQRGKVYEGKLSYLSMESVQWKEYSFVNAPADERSGVLGKGSQDIVESDDWTQAMRFYSLDMDNESILQLAESENIEILSNLSKREKSTVYTGIKGSFLLASADADLTLEENDEMAETDTAAEEQTEDKDILDVTDELRQDLNQVSTEEKEETVEEEQADVDKEQTDTTEDTEVAEGTEGEIPEGQEKESKNIDSENSEGAPKSRESEDEVSEGDVEEKPAEETDKAEDVEESETAEEDSKAELSVEDTEDTESKAEEASTEEDDIDSSTAEEDTKAEDGTELEQLRVELESIQEENAKLRKALHMNLAERVVDAKISLGLVGAEAREAEVSDHATRTPASLSDSLRDMASMTASGASTGLRGLHVDEEAENVDGESGATTIDENVDTEESAPEVEDSAEDQFVARMSDVLMGRIKLN